MKSYVIETRMKEALIAKLKEVAAENAWFDDGNFSIYDHSCGIDEAYYGGISDGEIGLARELLKTFFKDNNFNIDENKELEDES